MPYTDVVSTDALLANRPICSLCDTPMWLVRITAVGSNASERTFVCPNCDLDPAKAMTDDQFLNRWEPIARAPFGRDLELAVMEGGEIHALNFPSRRAVGGWLNAETEKRIEIRPTHWREWKAKQSDNAADQ